MKISKDRIIELEIVKKIERRKPKIFKYYMHLAIIVKKHIDTAMASKDAYLLYIVHATYLLSSTLKVDYPYCILRTLGTNIMTCAIDIGSQDSRLTFSTSWLFLRHQHKS